MDMMQWTATFIIGFIVGGGSVSWWMLWAEKRGKVTFHRKVTQ